MSAEIVTLDDGEMWIIEGKPGDYHARPVGPAIDGSWQHKYVLRAQLRDRTVTPPTEGDAK